MAQYTQRAICQTFVKMLEHMPLKALCEAVQRSVDCRPEAIIERFGLKRPIFSRVSLKQHHLAKGIRKQTIQRDGRRDR